MKNNFRKIAENACDDRLSRMSYLPGGSVGEVWKLEFESGTCAVAKTSNHSDTLDIEGYMLDYLSDHSNLPVPKVILSRPNLLVIDWVENQGQHNLVGDEDAADLLFDLHENTEKMHGFSCDTLIGSLSQMNPWTESWIEFFRDQRLHYMGQLALKSHHLEHVTFDKLQKLCDRLDNYITEPKQTSLLHGDIWTGNVLYHDQKIAAFIDPAIHYGHREIELAYTTLFHTFGEGFFPRYNDHYPLDKEFFTVRMPIYHLYPLLVHAVLFGGSYGQEVDAILDRFI